MRNAYHALRKKKGVYCLSEDPSLIGLPPHMYAEQCAKTINFTAGGWTSKPGKIDAIIDEKVAELNVTGVIVIDFMANSACLGTNWDGLPIPRTKTCKNNPALL
jgi:hypothetical protein